MRVIEKFLRLLVNLGALIGVASIVALMALTVTTVLFRFLGIAFPGTYSLAEILLIPAITFSLAYAAWEGAHTRVTLLVDRFPERVRNLIEAVMLAAGTVFWLAVARAAVLEALKSGRNQEVAPIIDVPVTPFRWLMVIAISLLCLLLVYQAVKRVSPPSMVPKPDESESSS